MRNFSIDIHGEGIALVTWDMPGKSMNVIDETVMDELEIIVGRIRSDMEIKGAIITSAKSTFSGGADLGMLSVYTTQRQAADDDAKRDLLIKQAFDISMKDWAYIPLHQQALAWGVSKKVKLTQRADNMVMLYWATKQDE